MQTTAQRVSAHQRKKQVPFATYPSPVNDTQEGGQGSKYPVGALWGTQATAGSGECPCCGKMPCELVPLALILGVHPWLECCSMGLSVMVLGITLGVGADRCLSSTVCGAQCSVSKTQVLFWKDSEQVNCRHETAVWETKKDEYAWALPLAFYFIHRTFPHDLLSLASSLALSMSPFFGGLLLPSSQMAVLLSC